MKTRKVLQPGYMKDFSCIGSDCEDNCCYGWKVTIDEKTYKLYKKVRIKELEKELLKNIKRIRKNPTKNAYAKINMNKENSCPFFKEDKLCDIQKKLGVKYLSDVCMTYPRITNCVDGVYEKSVTFSCPEVVRVALLNPRILEFDEIQEDIESRNIVGSNLDTQGINQKNNIKAYFWDLRIFSIYLMQNRKYSLWERIMVLGIFINKVQGYTDNNELDKIPQLIKDYEELIEKDTLKEELKNIPVNLTLQMQLMKEFNDQRFSLPLNSGSKGYIECVTQFLVGIEYNDSNSIEEITNKYKEAYEKYYKPFMNEHEYIFENYIVSHIFRYMFPLGSEKGVFDDYVKLVIHYSLLKVLLVGMSGFHKQLSEDIIVKLFYSLARAIDHNQTFLNSTYKLFSEGGYDTLPYMAILIKN